MEKDIAEKTDDVMGDVDFRIPSHYYGDVVRRMFLVGAVIMLLALPFFYRLIPAPIFFSVLAIIVVELAAGMTSPKTLWSAIVNVCIAIFGIFAFENEAISAFSRYDAETGYFWTNQLLALIFLIALYYSVKTVRRMSSRESRF
ncbi:MAG: hypothetical protein AAB950_00095 [Patescibacteria group bacterium]